MYAFCHMTRGKNTRMSVWGFLTHAHTVGTRSLFPSPRPGHEYSPGLAVICFVSHLLCA